MLAFINMFLASETVFLQPLIIATAIASVVGYLLGSISFSIIITKFFQHEDIRKYGSGNAGATNVMRSVGKLPAALTFIFDFLKCVVSILIGYFIFKYVCNSYDISETLVQMGKYAAGVGCILGHIYPLYFGFKGGKGVVSTAALICLIDWRVFIPTFITFCIVFAIKKIVSLGSIIGMASYPIYTFIIMFLFDYAGSPLGIGNSSLGYVIFSVVAAAVISAIIIFVHRSNIKRLIAGEEKPLTIRGKKTRETTDIDI